MHHVLYQLPLCCRLQRFFSITSFSALFSRLRSANICFRGRFSSYRSLLFFMSMASEIPASQQTFFSILSASTVLRTAMTWCSVKRAFRIAISLGASSLCKKIPKSEWHYYAGWLQFWRPSLALLSFVNRTPPPTRNPVHSSTQRQHGKPAISNSARKPIPIKPSSS